MLAGHEFTIKIMYIGGVGWGGGGAFHIQTSWPDLPYFPAHKMHRDFFLSKF